MLARWWLLPASACKIVNPLPWAQRRLIGEYIVVNTDVADGPFAEDIAIQLGGRGIKFKRAIFVFGLAFVYLIAKSADEKQHDGHKQGTVIAMSDQYRRA